MSKSASIKVALALGSNMGDKIGALRSAIEALAPYVCITHKSPVYETPAAYVTDQPAFLNAAVIGTTPMESRALLAAIKSIEAHIGRKPTFQYGPRVIDIDILFWGSDVIQTPQLSIPHPKMAERDFVMKPLSDIAPDWKHPLLGTRVSEIASHVASAETKRTEFVI